MLYLSCQEILFFNHVQTEKRKASQRFPSPVGESYFSIMVNFYMMVYEHSFHPLSGNLIFQSIECDCNGFQLGFRPLSGNLIFQWYFYPECNGNGFQFPPPVGESYFSIICFLLVSQITLFPSPVGESCFSICYLSVFWTCNNVSVPCRGILFFNEMTKEEQRQLAIEFPSPVGESYFSICLCTHL